MVGRGSAKGVGFWDVAYLITTDWIEKGQGSMVKDLRKTFCSAEPVSQTRRRLVNRAELPALILELGLCSFYL